MNITGLLCQFDDDFVKKGEPLFLRRLVLGMDAKDGVDAANTRAIFRPSPYGHV